jgi:hypothetical protein
VTGFGEFLRWIDYRIYWWGILAVRRRSTDIIPLADTAVSSNDERQAALPPTGFDEPQAAVGEASPLGGETRVNTTVMDRQFDACVAPLTGGGYVVVWISDNFGTTNTPRVILAHRYSATGAAVGGEILVTPGDTSSSPPVHVAVTGVSGGGFVVTWSQSNPQDFQDSPAGIYTQRFSSTGAAQGGNTRIAPPDGPLDFLSSPSIVDLADGGYLVAWADPPGSFARRFNASGGAVGGVITIDTAGNLVDVARLPTGNLVFAWSENDGSDFGIFKGIYNITTGAISGVARVNNATAGRQDDPQIAVLADGGFVIVWENELDDIHGQRFNASGNEVGAEFVVNVQTTGQQIDPSVVGLADGGFMATWASTIGDGSSLGVYGSTFDSAGTRIGAELLINQTQTGAQRTTQSQGQGLTQLINGRVVAVWDGQGPGDTDGVFQRAYSIDVNDAPNAVNDSASVNEDGVADIAVRGNDTDADGHALTITAVSNPPNGTATINANGTIRYTPDPNFNGSDSFTYTVSDGFGGTDTATVTVTVNPVDDLPSAVGDAVTVAGPTPTALSVLANDPDIDGGLKTIQAIAGAAIVPGQTAFLASGATARLNADGSITYTHHLPANRLVSAATAAATGAVNFQASDSFTYALNGGSSATVTVTINGTDEAGDFLIAPAGNAAMSGTAGSDLFLLHPSGALTIADAGAGDDGFYFGASFGAGDSINGGAGSGDQIALRGVYSLTFAANAFISVETIALLSGGNTAFEAAVGPASYNLTFVDANLAPGERLTINANALAASESFTANGSAETNGSFAFYSGFGVERLTGGGGNDGFFFGGGRLDVANDRVDGLTGGDDQLGLRGDFSQLVSFSSLTVRNIDTIALISAKDPRFGATSEAFSYNLRLHDDNLAAGATLTATGAGLAADETMTFDGSSETNGTLRLFGGAGNDVLIAGAGNDQLFGGLGADQLTGNAGNDTFFYTLASQSTAAARDTLFGFASGDRIDLSAIDAIAGGANDTFTFIGSAAFSAAGQVRLVQDGAGWLLEANFDADLGADMAISILGSDGYVPVAANIIL